MRKLFSAFLLAVFLCAPSSAKTPLRSADQFRADLEPSLLRLDRTIALSVDTPDLSAVASCLERLMFESILKGYSCQLTGGVLTVSPVYCDWYRVLRGAQDSLAASRLSRQDIQTLSAARRAVSAARKNGAKDHLTLVKSFHDDLVRASRYSANPSRGDAHSVLVEKEGTCDGYAAAFQLLCRLVGVESLIIRGKTGGRHSWNMVRVDGQWRHIDVTWDDPLPDTPCRVVYDYFMLTDSQISKDHSWEGDYPAAR